MPHLSSIHIYPVKSCQGIALSTAHLSPWGLQYDRHWMVVTPQGRFITQREVPRMALIQTAMTREALQLSAPGISDLQVPLAAKTGQLLAVEIWRDHCQAIDQGKEAAQWFSTVMQMECRLVRIGSGYDRPVNPKYATEPAQVSFADGYPLLMISQASLDYLNQRLGQSLPMNRFRPNLVISDCQPHAEDSWRKMQIDQILFEGVKPCERCVVTTIDQTTAERGVEPLRTLSSYRRAPGGILFGQNLIHRQIGTIQVGSTIEVLEGA